MITIGDPWGINIVEYDQARHRMMGRIQLLLSLGEMSTQDIARDLEERPGYVGLYLSELKENGAVIGEPVWDLANGEISMRWIWKLN